MKRNETKTPPATTTANPPPAYSYVRFSTPEQLKGDSLRRQLELSRSYSLAKGLRLDESLTLRDLGVSAFRGKNRTQGALSRFLAAVQEGRVPRGAFLLVESLDRLSRAEITEALTTFLQIINAGVTVVTLADEMTYSKESLDRNMGSLMMSLVIMARAHDESATKSRRLSAAWHGKRLNLSEQKLTALAPGWLQLSPDRRSFVPDAERVAIVRRIFKLSAQGYGKRRIAQMFNSEGVGTWGRGKRRGRGWHDSYIQKILSARAVLGEFQPHRMDGGQRIPEGQPIPDYFPPIVDHALFQRVNSKPKLSPGRDGNQVSNLFTGVAFDGETGAPMRFVNKGTKKRGNDRWKYLTSDHRRTHPDSPRLSWSYTHFEEHVLQFLQELDWASIAQGNGAAQNNAAEDELSALSEQIRTLTSSIDRVIKAIESTSQAPNALVTRLQSLEDERRNAEAKLNEKRDAFEKRRQTAIEISREAGLLKGLASNPKDLATRLRLRDEIRRKVARIDLFPKGLQRQWRNSEYHVRINSADRTFAITFKNGITRWVLCIGDRPESLTLQQLGEGEKMVWMIGPIRDGVVNWASGGPPPPNVLAAFGSPFP